MEHSDVKINHRDEIDGFIEKVKLKNGHEAEFMQAVVEVAEVIIPFMRENPKYSNQLLLERMVEPKEY